MLAVADACNNPDGTGAWLGNAAMMSKTGLSERGVQEAIKGAEKLGELEVDRGAGPNGCHRFRVLMATGGGVGQILPPAESAVGQTDDTSQVKADGPADSAPAAESAPPQNLPHPPAESAARTVREPKKNSPSGSSARTRTREAPATRGSRIDPNFTVTPEMVTWARENTPHVDGRRETEKFINYWMAKSGKDATKLDWKRTWNNWMIRAEEEAGRFPGNGAGHVSRISNAPKPVPVDERCPKHPTYRASTCGPCRADHHTATNNTRSVA